MSVITYDDLKIIREKFPDKKIVFCSGTFDLTHAGHALFLEDCGRLGDILVVGVGNDEVCRKNKGNERPVLNEHLRLKMIDSLKPVDFSFLHLSSPADGPHNALLEKIFILLRPDIYAVNDDAAEMDYRKSLSEKYGISIRVMPRRSPPEFDDISTSKIIDRIKKISDI